MYLVDKKYTLAKMYGRMRGYEPDSLSNAQLERKRDLCRGALAVMDKIMPGRTRKRGQSKLKEVVSLALIDLSEFHYMHNQVNRGLT